MQGHKVLKMKAAWILVAVCVIAAAVVAGREQSRFSETVYDYVALGDSYSAGQTPYGDPEGVSYADMIRDKLDECGVLGNYSKKGISGYSTEDVLGQLPSLRKLLHDAEIVTIDIGINDILRLPEVSDYMADPSCEHLDKAQAQAMEKRKEIDCNIRAIIEEIKKANHKEDPEIYIMGYFDAFPDRPEFRAVIGSLNETICIAATDNGAVYVDTMDAVGGDRPGHLVGDIHPTTEGYAVIAEEFWHYILRDLERKGS